MLQGWEHKHEKMGHSRHGVLRDALKKKCEALKKKMRCPQKKIAALTPRRPARCPQKSSCPQCDTTARDSRVFAGALAAICRRRRRSPQTLWERGLHMSASVSILQHPSCASIRQHTLRQRDELLGVVSIRQHPSASISIRQHTSAYLAPAR